MCSKPVAPEILGSTCGQRGNREARRIRCDEGSWPSHFIHFLEELFLYIEILDDCFDRPIDLLKAREVSVETSNIDLTNLFRYKKSGRGAFLEAF